MMATPLPQDPARNTVDSYRNTSGPCSTFRPAQAPDRRRRWTQRTAVTQGVTP